MQRRADLAAHSSQETDSPLGHRRGAGDADAVVLEVLSGPEYGNSVTEFQRVITSGTLDERRTVGGHHRDRREVAEVRAKRLVAFRHVGHVGLDDEELHPLEFNVVHATLETRFHEGRRGEGRAVEHGARSGDAAERARDGGIRQLDHDADIRT